VLVLSGESGIGKSALCAWAVGQAADLPVLSVRAVESEVDLPFAGLSELCAEDYELISRLPGPQARALDGALARSEARRGDRFAIGAAILGLLAVAGRGDPVFVVVDDAQWLDVASADALVFAARRLRHEGVAMLVATRPDSRFDAPSIGLPRMRLRRLDASAARKLLHAVHTGIPARVAEELADRSDGNPLALLELPRLLSEAQLDGAQAIDEPLPLAPTLVRALLERQSGLSDGARQGLVVAAASAGERVQPVLDALPAAGLDRTLLDSAEEAGVVAISGNRLEFRHPLLRSAIYHGATGSERRSAHAALAMVTGGELRTWHLAVATVGEDEAVAAMLERVGLDARGRGAPAAAAGAFERAARLSPPGERRTRRLIEAAREAYLAGGLTGAVRLLDDALAGAYGAVQRADIQHIRARILVLQGHTDAAYRLLVDEAGRISDVDPARTATMLAEACVHCLLAADLPKALTAARESCRVSARADLGVRAYAAAMLACALIMTGERVEAAALLDRFLPVLRHGDPLTEAGALVGVTAQCYFWLDRTDIASELLAGLIAAARKASAPAALLLPLSCRAELDLRTGRWAVAAAQFAEVARLGDDMAEPVYAAYALECLARMAAAAGDERRCRDQAAHAMALIEKHHNELGRLNVHSALGLLELGLGRVAAAIEALERSRDLAALHGLAEPDIVHWQPDLIEAYARAGDAPAARKALRSLDLQAQRTNGRWALGTAARCHGLLGDNRADDHFDAAVEHLHTLAAPFEVARTHLCRGEWLRRAGKRIDARRALRQAMDEFDRLGAHAWTARAISELRATGENPRPRSQTIDRDELTAHELQVARIVANGASNRDAAAALFLSPKTIEFHLAHIYRKLGVRTRAQLAGVAARRGWLDDTGPVTGAARLEAHSRD
jgi:DNA-binding CsgD family transcriptional regulator